MFLNISTWFTVSLKVVVFGMMIFRTVETGPHHNSFISIQCPSSHTWSTCAHLLCGLDFLPVGGILQMKCLFHIVR
jgi:hypothetical protein